MDLHLPCETFKTHSRMEPVLGYEPGTYKSFG